MGDREDDVTPQRKRIAVAVSGNSSQPSLLTWCVWRV